jgi:polysaccharide deacetylase 2 family uncharacterized protein YibQ
LANKSANKRNSNKPGGSRYAALAILTMILLAVGGYLVFKPGTTVTTSVLPTIQQAPAPLHQPKPHPPVAHNYSVSKNGHLPRHNYTATAIVPEDTSTDPKLIGRSGRLAIIIDDMGNSLQEARSLACIGVPLTFSIIPGLHSYREVSSFAASNGIETMIHIPMQSKGWPERRLESNGLLVSMDDAAISERLEEFIRNIPSAVGANNHMGSEFTECEDKMRVVLDTLKGKRLYFVDSVTSPRTVGMRVARKLDMKTGSRSVFLDNEQNSAYIQGQLNQAIRLAKKTGGVIAICHPHPTTICALKAALPGLARQGITLVPVSQLVR